MTRPARAPLLDRYVLPARPSGAWDGDHPADALARWECAALRFADNDNAPSVPDGRDILLAAILAGPALALTASLALLLMP